jgi:hypothetical protein
MRGAIPDLIDDDLRAFLHGPVSAILATADELHVPDATRIAGVAALDGRRLRVLISTEATAARANAAAPGSAVAVLVTDITTYRSVQWKGVVESWHERTPGDLALVHRHVGAFAGASAVVGMDPVRAPLMFPREVVAVVLRVDEAFDQTPGPGAGRRMEARR